jgi:Winged helix domain, variant/ATPase family associated with various cellular activities (AAA)
MSGADPSLAHLLGRLRVLEARVRRAVEHRRDADPNFDDPFRGLYLSEADVDRLLDPDPAPEDDPGGDLLEGVEREADEAEAELRLRGIAAAFELTPLDLELLVVALAPDLDARFERLYGYLHDDVTRRRASVGLALELAGCLPAAAAARRRLTDSGPLVEGGLVLVEDRERPFLSRSLRVPDRVTMHLLGEDGPDPALARFLAPIHSCLTGDPHALAAVLRAGGGLVYVQEPVGSVGRALGAEALRLAGRPALALDLEALEAGDDFGDLARLAVREARLTGAGLVAGPIDAPAGHDPTLVRRLAEPDWPVVLTGKRTWDPSWSRRVPLLLELGQVTRAAREGAWRAAFNGDAPPDLDPAAATSQFRLGPEQVERAAAAARLVAAHAGRALTAQDLRAGARAQNAGGLERLARRLTPRAAWRDLVLPEETVEHLQELAARAEHRERVLDEWAMGGSRGRGVTALFAGESGTGKTMAAEVLAGGLGVDLYTIDLATVVDKYVGETEKNLDRIFAEAERVHGILFFDEADAIFGKRSEVRDAHDRYANIEVAYLLQRMEAFDGIAILATNLRANIDDAFLRRLDAVVDFPMPDKEQRERLWERCLGPLVPRSDDLDLDFCAGAFELSGGNIRNIAVAAAYLAANDDRAVGMADLIRGTRREYRKLGRLIGEAEFGPYFRLVEQ